jgi:hypothetical protein
MYGSIRILYCNEAAFWSGRNQCCGSGSGLTGPSWLDPYAGDQFLSPNFANSWAKYTAIFPIAPIGSHRKSR